MVYYEASNHYTIRILGNVKVTCLESRYISERERVRTRRINRRGTLPMLTCEETLTT